MIRGRCALWLAGALAAIGCKSQPAAPAAPASTAEADALWALAPADARVGLVASPRAVALLERAVIAIDGLLDAPDLALQRAALRSALTRELGVSQLRLAGLGLAANQGFAGFGGANGDGILILPVIDRDRFVAAVHGTKQADHDELGPLTCKPLGGRYVCVHRPERFAALGHGRLDAALRTAGARGDLEFVGRDLDEPGGPTAAVVAQLDHGAFVVRGTVGGVPDQVIRLIGSPSRPRADAAAASGFGVIDLAPYLALLPPLPIARGVTLADLARSVSGPLTFAAAAGTAQLDIRIPLRDPAPARQVLEHCTDLPRLARVAIVKDGACRVAIPSTGYGFVGKVDGQELRITSDRMGASTSIAPTPLAPPPLAPPPLAPTPLAAELAAQDWSIAVFGRGNFLGLLDMPRMPQFLAAFRSQSELALSVLPWFSELGLGIRREGRTVRFVFGVRTAWDNPEDVVRKLLAISSDQILSGRAAETGRSIAAAAPGSPFAQDLKAGHGGMLAVIPLAIFPAVAIPAFMDYMKRSKKTEAELQLNKIGKIAERTYTETTVFPRGRAGLTPPTTCCGQPSNHCVTSLDDWRKNPVWAALDFEIDEPSLFRYSYESNGKTFTAKAVGDLDCDGVEITYELKGKIDADGNPVTQLIKPPPGAD